jgi:hypothetical protein
MLTQLPPEAFDSSDCPRAYGISLGWKLFLVGFGILFGLGGLAGAVLPLLYLPHDQSGAIWTLSAISAGFAALGAYAVFSALMYRVVLTPDGVELTEPFRSRRLSCAEILGRRMVRTQQGLRTLVLVPKDERVKKLKIPLILKRDGAFDAWIARLADLDQQDLDRSEHEISETLYQDLMPQEREARVKQLKVIARWVNWTAIALAFGTVLLPDYHHLLMGTLIAVPWIAVVLVARFQPLYRFGGRRNDPHPDLTQALMIPGLLLMMRALADAHTLDWSGPLVLAVAGGLPLCAVALRVDPWFRRQRLAAVLTCFFILAYGFGAGLEIDVLADSTKPSIYVTHVISKRINHGSKSTTYYLTVEPWGPIAHNEEIRVSAARYRTADVGDAVCIYLGKGAFKVAWYQLRDCPENYVHALQPLHSFDGISLGTTAVDLRRTHGPPLRSLSPDHWLYDSIDEAHDGLLDVYFTHGATESSRRVIAVFFTGRTDGVPGDMPNLLGLTREELVQRFGEPLRQRQMPPPSGGNLLEFRNGIVALVRDGKTSGYGVYVLP